MPEPIQSQSEGITYRFIDDGEVTKDTYGKPDTFEVEFYPAVEDYVRLAEINAARYPMPSTGKLSLQAFLLISMFGMPALLFYFEYLIPALIVFGINLSLSIFFIPAAFRVDYRRYCSLVNPELENELVRVELHSDGLLAQSGANRSFHAWKSVKSVEDTKEAIFFFLIGGHGLAVRKTGFAYEGEAEAFINFARHHTKLLSSSNDSRLN